MLVQFALSSALIMTMVVMHALGLAALAHFVRDETREEHNRHLTPLSLRGVVFTVIIVFGLFALHGAEIWLFALFFLVVEALPNLESALYFSSITYGTIGYSDAAIAPEWRLVAAFEGIAGIILLGWSTAFFVRLLGRIGAH
jgi:hypothetical protein